MFKVNKKEPQIIEETCPKTFSLGSIERPTNRQWKLMTRINRLDTVCSLDIHLYIKSFGASQAVYRNLQCIKSPL